MKKLIAMLLTLIIILLQIVNILAASSGWAKDDIYFAKGKDIMQNFDDDNYITKISKTELNALFISLHKEIFGAVKSQHEESEIVEMISDISKSEEITREECIIISYNYIMRYFSLEEESNTLQFKDDASFTSQLGRTAASFLFNNNILFGTYAPDLKWPKASQVVISPQNFLTREEAIAICIKILRQAPVFGIAESDKTGWGFYSQKEISSDEIKEFLLNNWDEFNECIKISFINIKRIERHSEGRIYIVTEDTVNKSEFINSDKYSVLLSFMFRCNIIGIYVDNDSVSFVLSSYNNRLVQLVFDKEDNINDVRKIQLPDAINGNSHEGIWYSEVMLVN